MRPIEGGFRSGPLEGEEGGSKTIEPDEWDLKMIREAEEINGEEGVLIEALASELAIKL